MRKQLKIAGMSCCLVGFPGIAQAQVEFGFETQVGVFTIGLEPVKSSFIGAYDFYVGPAVKKALRDLGKSGRTDTLFGTGSSGGSSQIINRQNRPSAWRILFPNGKVPDDLELSYGARPGLTWTTGLERALPYWPIAGASRLQLFYMQDSNQFRLRAPSGLGILTDPTMVMTKASYRGFGGSFELPVWNISTNQANHLFRLGGGVIAYKTRTILEVNSAFLRLNEISSSKSVRPMLVGSYTYEPRLKPRVLGLTWGGLRVSVHAIQTDYFWSAGASITSLVRF
jgi:hypothetical protein